MNPDSNIQTTRDGAEFEAAPSSGISSAWLIILLGLIFYSSTLYLDHFGGELNRMVYIPGMTLREVQDIQPPDASSDGYAQGEKLYGVYCVACHQINGLGDAGKGFPPLAGSQWVKADNRVIRIVLNSVKGPIEVAGKQFDNPGMIAWRGQLDEEKLSAILTFIRGNKSWGNEFPPITKEQVKKISDETASRGAMNPWSAPELEKIPEKD